MREWTKLLVRPVPQARSAFTSFTFVAVKTVTNFSLAKSDITPNAMSVTNKCTDMVKSIKSPVINLCQSWFRLQEDENSRNS